jgi:hypothetical protein
MENLTFIAVTIFIIVVIALNIWGTVTCWNIPLAQRTGFCAMLHQ